LCSIADISFVGFNSFFPGRRSFAFGQAKMAQMGHILLSGSLKQIGTSVYSSFKTMILQSFFIRFDLYVCNFCRAFGRETVLFSGFFGIAFYFGDKNRRV